MKYYISFLVVLATSSHSAIIAASDRSKCDIYGTLFYEDIACQPVKDKRDDCPTEFQCDFQRPKTGCLFKGKNFLPGEDIPSNLTYSGCSIGCKCEDFNFIRCAVLDCPENFGRDRQDDCYLEYQLGKCCSVSEICPNSTSSEPKKCVVDDITYNIGERFTPRNTCLNCVCHENFTEGNYDEATCERQNCVSQVRYTEEIIKKCAPAYFNFRSEVALCCPDAFICPDPDLDHIMLVNHEADPNSKLQCDYGAQVLQLGEGFSRRIEKYGKDRELRCECSVPPLVTCIEV